MSIKSLSSHSLDEIETCLEESVPRPRLCHLKKWPDFQGYGFNLHAERTKLQQQIGKVDLDSPAESAGLKEKDRIIEVNYVNISNENHQQVVKRIRNGLEIDGKYHDDQVVLLVLDPEADEYYKKLNVVVRHDMPNVLKLKTVDRPAKQEEVEEIVGGEQVEDTNGGEQVEEVGEQLAQSPINQDDTINAYADCEIKCDQTDLVKESDVNNNEQVNKTATNSTSSLVNSQETSPLNQSKKSNNSSETTSPIQSQNSTLNRTNNVFPKDDIFKIEEIINSSELKRPESQRHSGVEFRHRPPRPPPPSAHSYRSSTVSTFTQAEELDRFLEMSAAEFKSYLKSKGRHDPRVMTLDMKRKHEIFQNM